MSKKIIFSYARMPEEALKSFKDSLDRLNIKVDGVAAHHGEQDKANRVFKDLKVNYQWASYRYIKYWPEKFNKTLYDELLKKEYSSYLPIVERYEPYDGGVLMSETRLMHDFSLACNMIEKTDPDMVVFAKSPESGLEICLYILAKHYNIDTYFTRMGLFNHTRLFVSDIWAPILDEDWKPTGSTIPFNIEGKISDRTLKFIEEIRNEDEVRVPEEIKKQGVKEGKNNKVEIKFPFRIKEIFKKNNPPKGPVFLKKLYKTSEALSLSIDNIDWAKKNYYFPLHYQPELTSMPSGREYVNQLKIIKLISDNLRDDECLIVKDHPSTFSNKMKSNSKFRNEEFYRWIKMMPKVKFISVTESSIKLMEKCDGVITIRGTAGLEAMIKGKPVLVFGNPVYLNGPGIIKHNQGENFTVALNSFRRNSNSNFEVSDVDEFIKNIESCAMVFSNEYEKELNKDILNQKTYIEVLIEGLQIISFNNSYYDK